MPVICISSSEKDSGKTAILSGIVKESLDRGIKTYVGELEQDEIVEHKKINELLDINNKNSSHSNSDLVFIELNENDLTAQKKVLDKFDAKVIFIEKNDDNFVNIEKLFNDRLVGFIVNGVKKYKKNLSNDNESNKKIIAILEEQRFFMTKTVDAISKSLTTSDIIGEQNY